MFHHLGLRTPDVARLAAFYAAALKPIGHVLASQDADGAGLGPQGDPQLWIHRTTARGPGLHLAFRAPDRATVDAFHAAALAAGGRDNGGPGIRTDYAPDYYAAFVIDPDGNNVEAVFTA